MNLESGSTVREDQTLVLTRCSYSNPRNYEYPTSSCNEIKSDDLNLIEGELYYTEIFMYNGGSTGHLTVSLEIPEINSSYVANSIPEI
jgi:hypothetical protein